MSDEDDKFKRDMEAAKAAYYKRTKTKPPSDSVKKAVQKATAAPVKKYKPKPQSPEVAAAIAKAEAGPKQVPNRTTDMDEVWHANQQRRSGNRVYESGPTQQGDVPAKPSLTPARSTPSISGKDIRQYERGAVYRGTQGSTVQERPYEGGDERYKSSWTGDPKNDLSWRTKGMKDPAQETEEERKRREQMDI